MKKQLGFVTLFLILIALFGVNIFGQKSVKPALEGTWCNQLASTMKISVKGNDISGSYTSLVGNAKGSYELEGRRTINDDGSQVLGFVVAWENKEKNASSVTSWAGQLQMVDGVETITTTWMLTFQTNPKDNWKSVWTNKDTFTRCSEKK